MSERKIWDEGDTIHVGLWKTLLFYQSFNAAMGLLDDIFDGLVFAESRRADPPGSPEDAALSRDTWANVREDVMAIIGDGDGQLTREWLRVFMADHRGFRQLARERYKHCLEADVYRLFE